MGLLSSLGLRRCTQWERLTLIDHLLLSPLTFLAIQAYHILVWLRGKPFHPPRPFRRRDGDDDRGGGGDGGGGGAIRVVCISDTHDQTIRDVPDGDVLVHAGDLTNKGSAADIQRQLDWLNSLPHAVKVVVPGNHDGYFDPRSRSSEDAGVKKLRLGSILFLQGDMTVQEIRGRKISIFGAGDVPECGPKEFAFQYTPATQPWLNRVPMQTDILVTHTHPKHHLDLDLGCPYLLREVWRVKPRLHVFGHCHSAYGREAVYFDEMQAAYERLLSRPRRGLFLDFVPNRAWLDIFKMACSGVHAVAWKWLMGGSQSNQGSIMVNAAQMYDSTSRIISRAHVVDI